MAPKSYDNEPLRSRSSSVSVVTDLRVDAWVQFAVGVGISSLRHRVQTGSEFHPASYQIGTGGKLAGV